MAVVGIDFGTLHSKVRYLQADLHLFFSHVFYRSVSLDIAG